MTLAANEPLTREVGDFGALPAAASATIHQGAICTVNASGYIPNGGFTLGDPFVGHADAKCDNSSGAAGERNVTLLSGVYRLEVALAASLEDVGRAVYASANDTYTFDPAGTAGPNTLVGHVVRRVDASYAVVEFRAIAPNGQVAPSANKVVYFDDFLGYQGVFTSETGSVGPWVGSVVGNATVAPGADVHGGAVVLTIAATSEAEDAFLYHGNQLNFDIDLLERFEARFKVTTPGTGVRVVLGMAGDHNLDKDTIAQNAWFSLDAGLALTAESDDGTTDVDDEAISTITTGVWYDGVIDFTDKEDVKFFLNGSQVATTRTFDMSAYTGNLQPYASLDKASGTGTGALTIDYIRVTAKRG